MNSRLICFVLTLVFVKSMSAQVDAYVDFTSNFRENVRSIQIDNYEAKRRDIKPIKSIHLETFIYKYTIEGKEERIDYIAGANNLVYHTEYKRDAYGNIILETMLDSKGGVLGKILYNYNANNQVIEEYMFSEYNDLESVTFFYYDKKGNCIEKIYEDGDRNRLKVHQLSYDSLSRLINIQVKNQAGKKTEDISFEYTNSKDPITINIFDYTKSDIRLKTYTFDYEYDSRMNWIKRQQYRIEKGELIPYYITDRKIEYFN